MTPPITPKAAVAELRQAISSVRAACGADPSCRPLLHSLDDAEAHLKEVSYSNEPDRGPDHVQRLQGALATAKNAVDSMYPGKEPDADDQASNLKEAAATTRRAFSDRRKSAAVASTK